MGNVEHNLTCRAGKGASYCLALALIAIFLLPTIRINELYLPSQMKAGFYDDYSRSGQDNAKNEYFNYVVKLVVGGCDMIPCMNEVYTYNFAKSFSSVKNEREDMGIVSVSGITLQKDSKWIKSAGMGGKA